MNDNPYSPPNSDAPVTLATELRFDSAKRLRSAIASTLVGVPLGAVITYFLFAFFCSIGSRVISDESYDSLSSSIFAYGAGPAILSSLLSGLLNPERPIATVIFSQFVGVVIGIFLACASFRWQFDLAAYFATTLVMPLILFALVRKSRSTRLSVSLGK